MNFMQHASRALGLTVGILALCVPAAAQKVSFTAHLTPNQEVPPTTSSARGTVLAIVDLTANTLTLDLTYDGLGSAETAAHIHGYAAAGVNANPVFTLPLGKHKSVVWTYPEAEEQSILDNLAYINVHSVSFPTGEIRGQLVRDDSAVSMSAMLNGVQEVPPVTTNAVGTAYFRLDPEADSVTFHYTFADLSSIQTGAHLHGYAPPGVNASILFTLPVGFHQSGVWNYAPADEPSILAGLLYINVHSMNFPNGEIRGQIVKDTTNPRNYCQGKVNSQGCTPMVSWSGTPTLTGGDDLMLMATNKINQQVGVLFWGGDETNMPFQGGILCINSPVVRSPLLDSGGSLLPTIDCTGVLTFHFSHFYMQQNLVGAGDLIYGQFWSRDPLDPQGIGLSDAVMFAVLP